MHGTCFAQASGVLLRLLAHPLLLGQRDSVKLLLWCEILIKGKIDSVSAHRVMAASAMCFVLES